MFLSDVCTAFFFYMYLVRCQIVAYISTVYSSPCPPPPDPCSECSVQCYSCLVCSRLGWLFFFLHLPTVFDWFRVWVCHLQCSDRSLCLTPLFECVFNVSSHTLHQSRTFLQVLLLLSRPVSIRDSRSLFCSAVQNALKANFFFL